MFNYLAKHWQQLGLESYGPPSNFAWCLMTPPPCQTAARHLVLLVLGRESSRPVLVAKMPRLAGDNHRVDSEIHALYLAQAARPSGFDSLPRVVATGEIEGRTLLVETALHGRQMTPNLVRHRFRECAESVVTWLIEFNQATCHAGGCDYDALLTGPLARLSPLLVRSKEDEWLVQQAYEATAPLRDSGVPAVFEHGDLFYPNLVLNDGRIGVFDWETSEPRSFPAGDLFFFLGLAAFARAGRFADARCVQPFDEAFFPMGEWTEHYVRRYVRALDLDPILLTPLFVAFWTRFLLTKIKRTTCAFMDDCSTREGGAAADYLTGQVHQLRDYIVWQHTLRNLTRLKWKV